jgi:hypothetical protein
MDEDRRNYFQEALEILGGTSRKLPEKAHLAALDRHLQAMNQNITTLGVILLAILQNKRQCENAAHPNFAAQTVGVPALTIPNELMEAARASGEMPYLIQEADRVVVKRQTVGRNVPFSVQPRSVM